ncbi:MAG: VTT domain-containing protein [Pirellulaceae bacterium]|jgi:uncharacterized membrane protein YdjX (TVP38/TMEM64 family)|nr:VTT domain-containing protein [Pirellulaceae bacterium]MDP6718204.1 VTT domain-containing protein [Pirellulaceae bacterium]
MKRKIIPIIVFVSLVALIAIMAHRYLTWEELVLHETALREQIAERPIRTLLIGFGIYVLVCLVPGTTGKSLVFGWLFGLWRGVMIVNCGLTVAAIMTFFASRYILRDVVQSRFGYHLRRIDDAIQRDGASYLFMLRVLHCPYTFTNYAFGATPIRASSFWWATQLGMLPGNIIFVYAGSRVPSVRQLADEGVASVFSWQLIAALVLLSVLPILLRYVAGRWRVFRVSRQA